MTPQSFPVSCKGRYYRRVGATNQLLRGAALDDFLLRRQGSSWDYAPLPGLALGDLDRTAMDYFVERARSKGRPPEGIESDGPEELMRHLRLYRAGQLTNAAALLFAPDPEDWFPGAKVRVGFFEGSELVYQDEVAGPVIKQPDAVVDLIYTKYLRAKVSYDGIHRVERFPFPEASVREAVVNAICHKRYASGAPIQIRVWDDRLRVGNTAVLPDGWDMGVLLGPHESEPYNPKVANAFFIAGLVETWGRGVQRVIDGCRADGIPDPEYRLAGGSILVDFTAPEDRVVRTGAVAPAEAARLPRNARIAIEVASAEGKVTTRKLSERAGISRPTAAAVLKGLVGEGMLAWHGKSERDPHQFYSLP